MTGFSPKKMAAYRRHHDKTLWVNKIYVIHSRRWYDTKSWRMCTRSLPLSQKQMTSQAVNCFIFFRRFIVPSWPQCELRRIICQLYLDVYSFRSAYDWLTYNLAGCNCIYTQLDVPNKYRNSYRSFQIAIRRSKNIVSKQEVEWKSMWKTLHLIAHQSNYVAWCCWTSFSRNGML